MQLKHKFSFGDTSSKRQERCHPVVYSNQSRTRLAREYGVQKNKQKSLPQFRQTTFSLCVYNPQYPTSNSSHYNLWHRPASAVSCLPFSLSLFLSVSLALDLSVSLSLYLSISISVCLSVSLSVYCSIYYCSIRYSYFGNCPSFYPKLQNVGQIKKSQNDEIVELQANNVP